MTDYDPLRGTSVSGLVHPDTYDPLNDQPNRTRVPVSSYDEGMIPGVPAKPRSALDAWKTVPTRDNPTGEEWGVPQGGAPARIRQAASDAYTNAPNMLTEKGEAAAERNLGWFGRNVVVPASRTAGMVLGGLAAVPAAAGATIGELTSAAGVPGLGREINFNAPLAGAIVPALKALDVKPPIMPSMRVPGTSIDLTPGKLPEPVPRTAGGIAAPELETALQREQLRRSGILGNQPGDGPSSPTGVEGPQPPPPGYVPGQRVWPPGTVATAQQAKDIANTAYTRADKLGGIVKPEVTDKLLDGLNKMPEQHKAGQIWAGDDPVAKAIAESSAELRGKPLTLAGIQEMDEAIGKRISDEWSITGTTGTGQRLIEVQKQLRQWVADLGEKDVSGGTGGFDALKQGREAWSQYAKMRDLERMQAKANMMENPTTSFKVMVRNMINDPDKIRGWSMEERAALKDAGDRGFLGNALHAFGGRLGKYVAGAVGSTTPLGPVLGYGAGLAAGEGAGVGARALVNSAMNKRITDALATLGKRVPAPEDAGGAIVVPR